MRTKISHTEWHCTLVILIVILTVYKKDTHHRLLTLLFLNVYKRLG